jgi:hypothetical protein
MSLLGLASAGIAITRTSGMRWGKFAASSRPTSDRMVPPDLDVIPQAVDPRGTLLSGMAYLYSTLCWGLGPDQSEATMSVCGMPSWFRRVAFAGAVLATATLSLGATPQPAAAQYYGGYPGYAYPYPYPYPYYPYYPYYAYGYPYWGWGWPYGISIGFGWGGWWGGRGGWGWGRGGWGHAGWGGGGFHGGGFHGGGFGGGFHGGGGGGHR